MSPPFSLWSAQDDVAIQERYPTEGASVALQELLGRNAKAISRRASKLGIAGSRGALWSQSEDDLLRQHYSKAPPEEVIGLLQGKRTWASILSRASKLGLTNVAVWTEEEDAMLREWYPDGRWVMLYRRLPGRSRSAISNRVTQLDLAMKPEAKLRNNRGAASKRGFHVSSSCGRVAGTVVSHARAGAIARKFDCPVLDGSAENAAYLDSIAGDVCALSGLPLVYRQRAHTRTGNASLDRIDSSKGYAKGNVQWVHKGINKLKGDMEEGRFIELCCAVARYKGGLK